MIAFRHCDSRYPFLWENTTQEDARWHRTGEGPVQYLADTPTGAWAEFLRHEEITEAVDLAGVSRSLWAVSIGDTAFASPKLPENTLRGGHESYADCQDEAARLRSEGAPALVAPSAALRGSAARGWRVEDGLQPGPDADGQVFVLFGARPSAVGWCVVSHGCPPVEVLDLMRPF